MRYALCHHRGMGIFEITYKPAHIHLGDFGGDGNIPFFPGFFPGGRVVLVREKSLTKPIKRPTAPGKLGDVETFRKAARWGAQ